MEIPPLTSTPPPPPPSGGAPPDGEREVLLVPAAGGSPSAWSSLSSPSPPPPHSLSGGAPPDVAGAYPSSPNCFNNPSTSAADGHRESLPPPDGEREVLLMPVAVRSPSSPSPSPSPSPPPSSLPLPPRSNMEQPISGGGGSREQKVPPCKELMKYFVGLSLVPLVVLKYQTKPHALFAENPAPAWSFFAFNFSYWLIALRIKEMPNHNDDLDDNPSTQWFRILNQAGIVCFLLSTSSLLSILLPQRLSIIGEKFWIVVIVGLAWLLIYSIYAVRSSISRIYSQHGVWKPPV